ncbi:MAG: hypothetical protein BHW40_11315 [Firmicutes bacterium CAG:65_45_313]|nr:MAG: hypothetical protein BHW40_11315 [Firmicutes bacterium CAG:65_45_313]
MKKHIMTALLITTMISMTACGGNKNTDTPAEETVVATSESVENPTANDEKVVLGTVNKEETATAETTATEVKTEEKTDTKATATPDPKATEAPKSTQAPETTAKPKSTTKPGTQTASVTATTKPATEKPKSTTAPKATATPAPKATAAPKATPTPTAAPVACQHTNTHVESSHDTYQVPIDGGCYEVWRTATRVCNDCGANLGEAPEKVNEVHTNVVHKQGVSATCTTDGYSAVYGCDCGSQPEVGGDVIPAFGHDYHDEFDHEEVDENGQTHIYFHSVCYTCGAENGSWEVGN